MPSLAESVGKELKTILIIVGVIWAFFLVSLAWPGIREFGLRPRTARGLIGIITMPWLHKDLKHLVSNTIPLVVLLFLLAGSRARWWLIVIEITLLSGAILWVAGWGSDRVHVGASTLISGLVAFLILGGFFERRPLSILVAVITCVLYGGSLLWGIIPHNEGVSWDGHLYGAIAGGLLAFQLAHLAKARAVAEAAGALPLILAFSASTALAQSPVGNVMQIHQRGGNRHAQEIGVAAAEADYDRTTTGQRLAATISRASAPLGTNTNPSSGGRSARSR